MVNKTNLFFEEEQQFRQFWIWILIGVTLLSISPLWIKLIRKIISANPPDSTLIILNLIMTPIVLGLCFLMYSAKLVVRLDQAGIFYQFFPFHLKEKVIVWSEIKRAYVRQYRPIAEYGGWGVRWGNNGKAYNVSGNQGLQIELTNGRKILFGTQSPEKVTEFLAQLDSSS